MRATLVFPVAMFAAACGAAEPRARIDLQPQARVSADLVRLGDVAILRSGDLDLLRRLVHLPVGRAPRAAAEGHLQQAALAAWVTRKAGVPAQALAWSGSEATRVLRAGDAVEGAAIARFAEEAAARSLSAAGASAQALARTVPRDVEIAGTGVRMELRPLGLPSARGHLVAWVDLWSAGAVVRTVPVSLEVSGARTPPAPLAMEQSRRAGAAILPVATPPARPAVARGEWATLRSGSGTVLLESRVEVLEDGEPGQDVRVRQPGTAGRVVGRVLAPGQLELVP